MTDPIRRRDDIAAVTVTVRMVDGIGHQVDLDREHVQMAVDMDLPRHEPDDITLFGQNSPRWQQPKTVNIRINAKMRPDGRELLRYTVLDQAEVEP